MNHARRRPFLSALGATAAGLALACTTALAHEPTEAMDYPGFRPDTPQAAVFVTDLESATIAVHPTIVRRAQRTAHRFDSQSQAIALLTAAGFSAVPGSQRIDLGALAADSQWALFQEDLAAIGAALGGRETDAQYHLVLEFLTPLSDSNIFGVHCYVLDPQGGNAFSFLLNSHHRIFADANLVAGGDSEAARTAMIERATEAAIAALRAQIDLERDKLARAAARKAALAAGDYEEAVFDDFERFVPVSVSPNSIPIGFVTFDDGQSTIEVSTTDAHPAVPDEADGNHVLRLDMDVTYWAAFAHFFVYEDDDGALWVPYDWREFDGISFWLYGQDSGVEFFVDIIDNRNPRTTSDDAERFVYTFRDDFSGWKRISIPFDAFVRKEVGNGAPDDGFGRDRVHGWAIGTGATDGPVTYYVDDFSLQHVGVAGHSDEAHTRDDYPMNELPMYGGQEKTPEQQRADTQYIRMMTEGGRSREEAAEIAARNGWNIFYRGDKATAIKRFNQAWLLDPDNALALWGFAVTSVDRGEFEAAERYYRMAMASDPDNTRLERDYRLTLRQMEKMRTVPGSPVE